MSVRLGAQRMDDLRTNREHVKNSARCAADMSALSTPRSPDFCVKERDTLATEDLASAGRALQVTADLCTRCDAQTETGAALSVTGIVRLVWCRRPSVLSPSSSSG